MSLCERGTHPSKRQLLKDDLNEFAAAGIATLQFDCRGFGASGGEPRQLFDVRRQAEDLDAALAFARRRDRRSKPHPPGPAAELADRAPQAELETLPHGHFDLYDGASIPIERDFLARTLL